MSNPGTNNPDSRIPSQSTPKRYRLYIDESGDHTFQLLTSKDIKFRRKKSNIAGLQLADILAYPVRQLCLLENKLISDPGNVFWEKVCGVVVKKFNRNEWTNEIKGYGKVLWPKAGFLK